MSLTESLVATALRELESQTCICGQPKRRNESFCRQCYFALHPGVRSQLYRTFSDGYAEIYDLAKDWLRTHTDRLSASARLVMKPEGPA